MNPYITEAVFVLPCEFKEMITAQEICDFFNNSLSELQTMDTHIMVTVYIFNGCLYSLYDYMPLFAVTELSPEDLPCGDASLFCDCVETVVEQIQKRRKNATESLKAGNVLFFVLDVSPNQSVQKRLERSASHAREPEWHFFFSHAPETQPVDFKHKLMKECHHPANITAKINLFDWILNKMVLNPDETDD